VEVLLVYLILAIGMSWVSIKEDRLQKKISDGFKPNAKDGDGDGLVQDGTKWQRKANKNGR
jgi:hypothetical protein